MSKKNTLKEELIEAIKNEDNKFDMSIFKTGSTEKVATCKTARCMAGHIEALRPKLAKQFAPEYTTPFWGLSHDKVAAAIWRVEMGEECRLDFYAYNIDKDMPDISRKEAIAHIRGTSKKWPQLV